MNEAPPRRGDEQFAGQVNSMFDRISGVYDRMNRVMTAGLDRTWRARAAERSRLQPGQSALDLCCGTGDVALVRRTVTAPVADRHKGQASRCWGGGHPGCQSQCRNAGKNGSA